MTTNEKSQNKSQLERFKETAKQVETDNSEEGFNRALKKVASSSSEPVRKGTKAKSAGQGR